MNIDAFIAAWFHERLTETFVRWMHALSMPGDGAFIGVALGLAVLALLSRRRWRALAGLILNVPCGMLLGEGLKHLVQRPRPYLAGAFVDWSGYSFPSGHAIGATLMYGAAVTMILPRLSGRRWRALLIFIAVTLVLGVAFSRVALGAHYLTDVLAGIVLGLIWLAICSVWIRRLNESTTTNLATDCPAGPGGGGALDGVAG
jgi:membrane-associated phospholipid phosphatase